MSLTWGTQLYITLIETAILEVIMILFLIYEFCNTRKLNERGEYAKVNVEPNMSKLEEIDESSEKIEQKMRQEALKKIIEMMKGNKGIGMNNNIEDCIDDDDRFKRRNSLPAYGNPIEELSDRPRSYPLSPRARREIEDPLINPLALGFDRDDDFWVPQDNVYAESKPPNPLGKIGKSYKDGDTQTFMVGGDHDIPFRDDDSDDSRPARHGRKPGRGRGRRGRLEDKIIEENQYLDQDSDAVDDEELDVIKEEDDIGATYGSPKKLQKGLNKNLIDEEELRRKIAEEDNQFLEEEKKLAEKEGEDNLIKEAEEELSKSKIGFNSPPSASDKSNLLNDTDVKIVPVPLNSSTTNIDGMQIPPSAEKRTFNENDIKGDLEPNHEGVIAPVALPNGNLVDKYGRRVNEKGYLIDENGNVIDTKTEKEMFNKDKLDARGDIPQPFNLERYNFNPHDITGAFAVGKNGKPILQETPDGKLADDSGKQVNEKGILIDEDGNVTDKYGRKKLDKDQLTNKGDLPPMLNYSGKQYKVFDVMGRYDKDPRGDIILERNEKGQIVDKKGRRCNDKGYLTDPDGNIVDNKGNRIWDKEHLYEGEFPKIFPFSLFNPDTIKGNFKRDKDGKPILKPAEKPGQFYDDDGNLVNKHGYLIDPDGNIIDKNGNIVFKKDILKDGEIPPVFRNGMIRQNSSSSLSKLMSEIDKEQDSDLDILKDFDEEEKGNTSVDSLMEDTPSNYNIANQRFDRPKYKKEPEEKYNEEEEYYDDSENDYDEGEEDEDENDDDDNDSITGPAGVPILNARQPRGKILKKKKKKKRRRRKKPKQEYEDPTAADYAMAKAYGGEAKGRPARKYKRKMSGRSTSSRASRGFSRPARRDKIFKGAGSVSGRDNDQLRTLRSEHSKGGLGKTGLTSKKFNKKRGPISKASNQDFDKVYDRKLDEFLENSSYEFESLGPPSRAMSRQGSAKGDHKLKGLESIYLQRLEANPTKNKKKKKRGKKDGEFMGSELSEQDDLAGLIEDNYKKMKKKFAPASARKRGRSQAPESNQPNIFTGNFDKYAKDKKLDVGENF